MKIMVVAVNGEVYHIHLPENTGAERSVFGKWRYGKTEVRNEVSEMRNCGKV